MARRLRRTVVSGGVTYPAGTEETTALAGAVTNPKAWEGEADPEPGANSDESSEPPRAGRGSSVEAWREYAESLGLTVDDGASRDDIIAQVDAQAS